MTNISVSYPTDWTEYELIDSGRGEKLERFGTYILARPDPRILWQKNLSQDAWSKANAVYHRSDQQIGEWNIRVAPPNPWHIQYKNFTFTLRPTEFKHVGVFPEQAVNWQWLQQTIAGKPLKILNLFAYTGGATLAALDAGATVTHVDSVKSTITWANENVKASHLENRSIRWIEDDAYKFVCREIKRGNTYDGIIMDPPRFGRGNKGEVWKLENDLPKLLEATKKILSPTPTCILINAYTADISPLVLHHMVAGTMKDYRGTISFGELTLKESHSERLLPSGIFARWSIK